MKRVDYEARFATALKEIASYMTPDQHRRHAERQYGLSPEESMEMAIDNMLDTAKQALKGYRPPKAKPDRSGLPPVASSGGPAEEDKKQEREDVARGGSID
jgi:hypothetical protein